MYRALDCEVSDGEVRRSDQPPHLLRVTTAVEILILMSAFCIDLLWDMVGRLLIAICDTKCCTTPSSQTHGTAFEASNLSFFLKISSNFSFFSRIFRSMTVSVICSACTSRLTVSVLSVRCFSSSCCLLLVSSSAENWKKPVPRALASVELLKCLSSGSCVLSSADRRLSISSTLLKTGKLTASPYRTFALPNTMSHLPQEPHQKRMRLTVSRDGHHVSWA